MVSLLGGDARFFWEENIAFFARIPLSWDSSLNTGIGINSANTLWITSYLNFSSFFSNFGLSWFLINTIFWIVPAIITSFFSAFFLYRFIFPTQRIFSILAGIIFATNTYFLTIFFGGQQGVSLSYALIPFVLLGFTNLLERQNWEKALIAGIIFSIQIMFDPRIALLSILGVAAVYVFNYKLFTKKLFLKILICCGLVVLLHFYWIVPIVLFGSSLASEGIGSVDSLRFLSFASFENSISLLHPNWPDNIFGKIYFMKSEFILIAILAYASLLFLSSRFIDKNKIPTILAFAFIGIIGVFLSKGANDPVGDIYIWLFKNIPGFFLFRDSTKFYSLVAISYSILIPFVLFSLSEFFKNKTFKKILILLFIIFWIYTLRLFPLSSVFEFKEIPQSYIDFKNFIIEKNQFFRTLWIPSWQRYGYFSDINPAIGRYELLKSKDAFGMTQDLREKDVTLLRDWGIKYIVVPEDSEEELFLEDRKYDDEKYQKTISSLEEIAWLEKIHTFGKIAVFEISNPRDRFWSPKENLKIEYNFINPTKYLVNIQNAEKGDMLVFSESYDRNWIAINSQMKVKSSRFKELNSFRLPEKGKYSFEIYYAPQTWVNIGLMFSGLTIVGIVFIFIRKHIRKTK